MTEDFKRKLTAILSADVVGYSRLMGDDEAATVKTLETYKGVMSSLIKQHRGRVVDSPGDNLLAEFGSVVDAVQCGVSIQKELQTRNADLPENRRMEFRIGINLGDVIEEEDRIYGDGVNIAARLEALADPGGICISKTAFEQIESKLPFGYRFIGDQTVKNIAKPIGAYKVLMETRLIDEEELKAKTPLWRRKSILSLGIIVILIIVTFLYWNFYTPRRSIKSASIEPEQIAVPDVKETPKTIAVLPFENISPEKDQEYFVDGLTEELINKLAQVKDLQVIGRTSSFHFKDKNIDLQTIGETLDVTYLLEGSVRKSGNQLRITAQLIKALDGYHLFSETYNRELKDIFTIQDEIAEAVTTALSVTLGVGEFNRPGMTRNIEAYDLYLRAEANLDTFNPDFHLTAIDQFKRALDIDPDFGLAWYKLSGAYAYAVASLPPRQTVGFDEREEEALEHARSIASDMPELLRKTAYEYYENVDWLEADQIYKQILDERGHTDSDSNLSYGLLLMRAGRTNDALPFLQRAKHLNPLDTEIYAYIGVALFNLKRIDEALVEARRGQKLGGPDFGHIVTEYLVALEANDRTRAAAIITPYDNLGGDYSLVEILHTEDTETALSKLKELSKASDIPPTDRLYLLHISSMLGDPELAFENFIESGAFDTPGAIWHPMHRGIWQLPAFKTYVRDIGLYHYWRASDDWGDYCHPVGDDDFLCD